MKVFGYIAGFIIALFLFSLWEGCTKPENSPAPAPQSKTIIDSGYNQWTAACDTSTISINGVSVYQGIPYGKSTVTVYAQLPGTAQKWTQLPAHNILTYLSKRIKDTMYVSNIGEAGLTITYRSDTACVFKNYMWLKAIVVENP